MFDCLAVSWVIDAGSPPAMTDARKIWLNSRLAGFVRLDETAIHLPNNHRRLGREKRWIFTAAALGGWLQVFASPHFSRLPSLFYLEDSPRTPRGTADSRGSFFLSGGVPQTPCAEQ
jgi:hypothetical protein